MRFVAVLGTAAAFMVSRAPGALYRALPRVQPALPMVSTTAEKSLAALVRPRTVVLGPGAAASGGTPWAIALAVPTVVAFAAGGGRGRLARLGGRPPTGESRGLATHSRRSPHPCFNFICDLTKL